MNNRGNSLIGSFLILFFLGGLVLFSYRGVGTLAQPFSSSTKDSFAVFPIKKPFKVITNYKTATVTLEELFQDRAELIVNFWATWCPPCLEELPSVEYLNRQLGTPTNNNIPRLVTISVDEDPKEVTKLFKTLEYPVSLIVLHDPDGELSLQMGTSKFPETYLINKQGNVLRKWVGPQNWLSGNVIQSLN